MILITGAARSGTTLVAGIIGKLGGRLGNVNTLNEALEVREGVVKPYLRSIGADPACQKPLPKREDIRPDPQWRDKVLKGLNGADVYKGAKICLMHELWTAAFPEAKFVIVRRDKAGIVDSCMRTNFMRAYGDAEGWGRWVDVHLERVEELKAAANCIEVWPKDFIADPEAFRPVAEFCGLEFNPEAVRGEVNPGLYRKVEAA